MILLLLKKTDQVKIIKSATWKGLLGLTDFSTTLKTLSIHDVLVSRTVETLYHINSRTSFILSSKIFKINSNRGQRQGRQFKC